MSSADTAPSGPDFGQGLPSSALAEGQMLLGQVDGEPVLLVRKDGECFAIGATCTHYSAPLIDGLLVGHTVRCPWHHAAFCLRSGEAVRAPALDPVPCREVEESGGLIRVGALRTPAARSAPDDAPAAIVIVGGGAAGSAAAEMLRREGYTGRLTILSTDDSVPCDRPNLSKDWLAGTAPEAWVPLRPPAFYREHDIELLLDTTVTAIDTAARRLTLDDGQSLGYDRLLLATGARPRQLQIPGADLPHVHYLRTWADSRELIADLGEGRRAVIIGSSFIGLEVAASLRSRGIEVDVVGRETALMESVLGAEVGGLLRRLHEEHGVRFHLGCSPLSIDAAGVKLDNGETLAADLVVIGIGVQPALELATAAGLAVDRGVSVDARLQTSAPGVYAAGDIARWPDALTGEALRVEHWVVAQRQGQTAARNMLGRNEVFDMVPFFWTVQYDFSLAYVGHAERFDTVEIDGDLDGRDCEIRYLRDGQKLAAAFIGRDLDGLRTEVEFERALAARAAATATPSGAQP